MANKKRNPDRESKRYPTDLFVDQVERIDEIVKFRNSLKNGPVCSRAQIIKEFIEDGLNDNGLHYDRPADQP